MGWCLSHTSLGFSILFPDASRGQGESERQLSLPLCPLSSCYLGSRIKGTNYIPPQTFGLMSKWGSVVISTLSPQRPCLSLSRAMCTRASPDVTLPAWTAPEGRLIPLSAAAPLISHMVMAGRNWLHSDLHRPPGAGRDLQVKPCQCTHTV